MDALGPDLQTIYNLLHDLKRFPLPQSEHQEEQSGGRESSPRAGESPRLLACSPAREGEGARDSCQQQHFWGRGVFLGGVNV